MLNKEDLNQICTAVNNLNNDIREIHTGHEIENEYTRILEQTKSVLNATVNDIEANREIKKHMGEECCDIMVACLTFLKQNYTDKQIQILYDLVNYKNKKRGYLKE